MSRLPDRQADASGHCSQMIAIASGKGGVGKTWFSITLTHALARQNQRVLLFDGDLGLANVDIQLGLMPEKDLANVLAGKYDLRESIFTFSDGGFDMIAGRSGSGDLASLETRHLCRLRDDLASLSMDYDFVVVDLEAGVDQAVRTFTHGCRLILVLITDEPTSLTDAYAFIKLIRAENAQSDIRIIVNMAEHSEAGEKTYETLLQACRNFLGFSPPLAGVIERDNKIRDSIRHQTAILTRYPHTPAARHVESIATQLLA